MTRTLVVIALVFLAAVLVLLLVLVSRRVVLARRERRHDESERRVRPLAIALVEDGAPEVPELSSADQAVLAEVLGRYSRQLRGEANTRIAAYFHDSVALREALSDLA